MDRIAARYGLLHCNIRSWVPPQVGSIVRLRLATLQKSTRQTASRRQAKQGAILQRQNEQQGPSSSSPTLKKLEHIRLSFRQDTDAIGVRLQASPEILREWVKEFLRLGEAKLLQASDSSEVARILHNLDRRYRSEKDLESQELIHDLFKAVREAYVAGSMPSASSLPLHLLSYYKESGRFDEGIDLWNWLSKADDAAFTPIYAGAAIELLAVYGAGTRYCEDIYQRTLDQQGDISSQYHLSPGAILPDRSKAVRIKGTSLGLLQGILTARVLYGKWQSSYLTLDTAFRLRPTQIVPRVLDVFVYERSLFEALPVFFMYCRGGNRVVSGGTLMAILRSIKTLANQTSAYKTRIRVVRAMFAVIEAHVGSAGVLDTKHLNVMVNAIVSAMPQRSITAVSDPNPDKDLTRTVLDVLAKLVAYFSAHNARPDSKTFAQVISPALALGYPKVASAVAQDMIDLGISPEKPVAQDVLKAAGLLGDPDLLKTAWTWIRNSSSYSVEQTPDPRSWVIMTVVARSCGVGSYAENQLEESTSRARTAVQSIENDSVLQYFSTEQQSRNLQADDIHNFENLCAEAHESLDRMKRLQRGRFRNFKEHPVNEDTIFAWPEPPDESWERNLYNELTLENGGQNSSPAPVKNSNDLQDQSPAVSDTGIQFDELRYFNWKTINRLLVQAEVFEKRLEASTDAAIKEQRASSQQRSTTGHEKTGAARQLTTVNQFQAYLQDVENERNRQMTEEEWRNRILGLRNPDYEFLTNINTPLLS